MKTLKLAVGIAVVGIAGMAVSNAEPLAQAVAGQKEKVVFLTGSRIPIRVKVKAIGTNTTSPLSIQTRAQIDRSGQFTTARVLALDPAISIVGLGH